MAVAFSGGHDSTALLHCTVHAARALGLQVHALHVHHGLQADADRWQRHVQAQCRRWARAGLPLHLHLRRLHGAPGAGDSVEAWARRERYRALAAMAREAGCDTVLLAQHRRDQAETVLLQLLRGAGARGRAAMPAAAERDGIRWLRPWLAQPRTAIEAYLRRHRLRWVDDASNAEPRFARSRLRTAVWPVLEQAFPDAAVALAAAADRAAEEAACLRDLAALDAMTAVDGAGALRLAAWQALPAPRRANLLRHWLADRLGRGAPDTLLRRLAAELPGATRGAWPAPGGALRLHRGHLHWRAEAEAGRGEAAAATVHDLRRPGRHRLPGWPGTLRVRKVDSGGVALAQLAAVTVTPRRAGDRFQRHPAGPPRGLKKQFQDAGVPAWRRDGPVLRDAAGAPLFVAGLGLDARARVSAGGAQRELDWEPDAGR